MYRAKKLAALLLSAVMMVSVPSFVLAEDMSISQQTDVEILTKQAVVKSVCTEEAPCLRLGEGEFGGPTLIVYVSENTPIIDNETGFPMALSDVQPGSLVVAYYSPDITKTLPPQANAVAIVANVQEKTGPAVFLQANEVEKQGKNVVVHSQDYVITIPPQSPVTSYQTKNIITADTITPGSKLFVWFDLVLESYPAQASATKAVAVQIPAADGEGFETDGAMQVEMNKIIANGTEISCDFIYTGSTTMLPLRAVSEALGFTIEWNGDTQTAYLDNGEVKTVVTIGEDSYYKASSKAIGLTAPFSFGAAPELIGGSTYVPAELFNLLASNPDAVKVVGSTLEINI